MKTLMGKNLDRISYPPSRLKASTFSGLSKKDFVPLADVPDYFWKIPGSPGRRPNDNPSHFADMDKPLPDGPNAGKTLLDLGIVHSAYEVKMLNAHAAALVAGIDAGLAAAAPLPNVTGSREATLAGVDLMRKTCANLSPKAIVDAFASGEDLWEQFGDATIATCVEGARTLAMLWESAWAEGNGAAIATSKLTARDKDDLVTLYSHKDFIPSRTLKQLIEGS